MKKLFTALITVCLLLFLGVTAHAATSVTVSLSDPEAIGDAVSVVGWEAGDEAAPASSYSSTAIPTTIPIREAQTGYQPVNVEMVMENGVPVIRKTFETPPDFDPLALLENLGNNGYSFSCREILRRELPGELLSHPASKVAVLRVEQDDVEAVARMLPATLAYEENGYMGLLYLDASSISTEPEDYETYTYTYTDTREIGGLPRNDPSYLDKELNGMTLTGVSFAQGQDGQYTATAAYEGTATGKRPVSHVATATYLGEITMELPGKMQYIVVYEGTPIVQPTPDISETELADEPITPETQPPITPVEESNQPNQFPLTAVCAFLIGVVAAMICMAIIYTKGRKKTHEKIEALKALITESQ